MSMNSSFRNAALHMATVAGVALSLGMGDMAHAADTTGKFTVRGIGSSPCSAFNSAVQSKDDGALKAYASWLLGYYSAYNRLVSGNFDAVPSADVNATISVVASACQRSPAIPVEQVTFSVLRSFAPLRLQAESPLVTLTSDGKSIELREETLRFVERRLKELGHYKGQETGKPSPQIVQAIKAFQTAQKIPVNGLPNLFTLVRIAKPQ